jgi:serine protease Do
LAGIFINYRTRDGHWAARLLFEALAKRFGAHLVFLASESIRPGDDFAQEIEQRLANTDVLLAIIGLSWLSASDGSGRRIDDPDDWVRHEIRTALTNGTTVIPVLIDGADHLSSSALPGDIEELGRCQSLRLQHEEGHASDVAALLARLAKHVGSYVAEPWRVRLWDANGAVCGAGVLLSENRLLTSAQAVAGIGEVTAELVGLAHQPRITARVVSEDLVPRGDGNLGDIALLELTEVVKARAGAILRRTALSWDRPVYVCGFPAGRDVDVRLHAMLTGTGGSTGEWLRIAGTSPDRQLGCVGLRGAGVVDSETHDVIGIIVGGRPGAHDLAWMIPTETITSHIPRAATWTTGGAAVDEEFSKPVDHSADRVESTEDLRKWIAHRDTGDRLRIVVGTHSEVYSVVASSSRERQSLTSLRDERSTSSTLGSFDLALDATGKTPDELARRVLGRAGIPLTDETEPVDLMARSPSMTVVIDRVDQAEDPVAVMKDVVAPLLGRGCRLVLGFREETSESLALARSWEPDVNAFDRRLARLTAALAELEGAERQIMGLRTEVVQPGPVSDDSAFLTALPRVLRETAGEEGADGERAQRLLGRGERKIARSSRRARRSLAQLEQWVVERRDFRGMLEAYRDMANENGLAEDLECSARYRVAHDLLWHSPTDLPRAIEAVREYREAIRLTIDGRRTWRSGDDGL